MEITVGSVVLSKAGRDKGNYLVVVAQSEGFAFVCDGKERPLERPKKKNILHLTATSKQLPIEKIDNNRQLKNLLKDL